ncbi:MAG TPA: DUF1858 domain-containing protein [Firmicutes bacterium]|nr:DUF1858 domain-containing protein [Bacillota bacterium]
MPKFKINIRNLPAACGGKRGECAVCIYIKRKELVPVEKKLDLKKSVRDLCRENPEIAEIMKELGFENITCPGMLNTVGRFMTIPKGAAMRGIELEQIKTEFRNRGYTIIE